MTMGIGIGLGLPFTAGKGGEPWYGASVLDLDFENGRFWWDGTGYADEAALLLATGGVRVGDVVTFTPQVLSGQLAADPGFDGTLGASGWAASPSYSGNVQLAISGGKLRNTPVNTGQSRFRAQVAVTVGKAYRWAIAQTDAGTKSGSMNVGSNTDLGSSVSVTISGANAAEIALYQAAEAATMYHGVVVSGTTAEREYDNWSIVEVGPLSAGHSTLGRAVDIAGTTPAAASGNKVLWQSDADNERNRQRIVYDGSGNLRFISTIGNSEQANLNFGAVPTSTPFELRVSMATNRMIGRLDAGASLMDSSASLAGVSHMRIGRSFTGEAWDGEIGRVRLYEHERLPADALFIAGDSYVAGAGGVGLAATAMADSRAAWHDPGTGGWTLAQVRQLVLDNVAVFAGASVVVWDGNGANGFTTLQDALDDYERIASAAASAGARLVIVGPLKRAALTSQQNSDMGALQAALASAYGDGYVDAQAILAARATSPGDDADVAAGVCPDSLLQADNAHLTSAAMGYVWGDAGGIEATLIANGW